MLHPSTSHTAGWSYVIYGWLYFHPSTSSGSSISAALCIQPKIWRTHSFYLTRWLWIELGMISKIISHCFFLFGKMLSLLWQNSDIIRLIFIVANGQILKNYLAIWSHCSYATLNVFMTSAPGTHFKCFEPEGEDLRCSEDAPRTASSLPTWKRSPSGWSKSSAESILTMSRLKVYIGKLK